MEAWSHSPVSEFEITFFVDTNILSYLIDDTYPLLNGFIKKLKKSPVIELISSEYVLLEFIGVRKREHYLREALSQSQSLGKPLNLSSLLKYHNQYSLPEIDFHSLLPTIKTNVDTEKDRITSEFGIIFKSGFHRNLYNPTSDICLSTKISKEDSLVLVSAILPNEGSINNDVIILTNDVDFHSWFYESEVERNIDNIFQVLGVLKPDLQHIKKINGSNNQQFNLTENIDLVNVMENFNSLLLNNLKRRLSHLFLGKTFSPSSPNIPNDIICFEAILDNTIFNNKHITIIGKDLDFVYNSDQQVSFWSNGKEIDKQGFAATADNNYLSFKLQIDDADKDKPNILAKLKNAGHLIFIHPDN
jgi:hypothetical protein